MSVLELTAFQKLGIHNSVNDVINVQVSVYTSYPYRKQAKS